MRCLRTLTVSRCKDISSYICDLSADVICPRLEELVLDLRVHGKKFDIQALIGIAGVRASRGTKLKSVRIASRDKSVQSCVLKLEQHVPHVECDIGVAAVCDNDGGDYSDDED